MDGAFAADFEIRTLAPDEKISEPGFYNISLDRHHGQPCDGPSVTSGVLRTLEKKTPDDYWSFSLLNPDRMERKDTDALRMGRAMAAYIEGGEEEVKRHFMVLPANKPNRPTEQQINAFMEGRASEVAERSIKFWARVETDPREEITKAQWDLIVDMGKALAKDPAASAALGGMPELTMAWFDEINGLWCLARPDQLAFSGMLSDYKKVAPGGRPFNAALCDNLITRYGYDMQMAFASEGFEELTENWPNAVGLVFQSEEKPHHAILRSIEDEDLHMGAFLNRESRRLFRECLDSGNWWGPGEEVGAYRRPDWQREQILERMNTAGVAP